MGNLYFRRATSNDVKMIYEWANDDETRKNSFNQSKIEYDTHVKWFTNLLNSSNRILYIFQDDNEPIGQVRLDIYDNKAEISYTISPSHRGKKYGEKMIKLLPDKVREDFPQITELFAEVKPENTPSNRIFSKEGYTEKCIVYTLNL